MVYVHAIPLRMNPDGSLSEIGTLIRVTDGVGIQREFVSGRVLYHETLREALLRHLEKDLGAMSLPRLPVVLAPLTVAEFFPSPDSVLHDARQHAVSLVYAVPIDGEPSPCDDALGFSWFTPEEAVDPLLHLEMAPGHADLLRLLLLSSGSRL